MIRLTNLSKNYRSFKAVDNLSLQVKAGEIYGFLGPNGAGKTTTIRMITGALQASLGEVNVGSYSIKNNPQEAKQLMGYIPDRPFLYEKLTGWEFISFIGGLYKMEKKEIVVLGEKMLGIFELLDWRHKLIENYSHGMKQRLIMASALIHKPKVLVVDEPMVGLDPRGTKLVVDIFKFLSSNLNIAIFVSTHTMSLASRLCDRIGIISHGKLVAEGTEDDIQKQMGTDGELEEVFLKLTEDTVQSNADLAEIFN